ncbi:hypothetical protein ACFOZ7_18255 [Natribaculum luteum]|uniref:DUF8119 domain-containing protein n=1 Tax=Natribaculum luteum TaxID=1586232 RepID=A0ABD5P3M0_9EURY|nr:hypothetical protein [Natribaculum luteum]
MTDDRETDREPNRASPWRAAVRNSWRLLLDLAVVGLWVLLVTLVALSAGLSRVQFYGLVFLGVVAYVQVTSGWERLGRG